ncbi:MAG: NAD-dependent epimerase/dehydratase family protein [Actinophytocola sp.]|uniref:NAD-dependent epimerase/dehydratase family protein n=1 Tax=Actinophytocola sp. TaxID=1872138 RepID=UPI001321D288|nr:NAD-dependent epimerase/dehydratase family protein [Actinophytocola sp.]MPZ81677.1 NAD-dependent epimerase/dehydratase family protein [Actinophytocola sp.]
MVADETELEQLLSTPSPALVADLCAGDGDLVVLGAGGKMGPTLCMLAARALASGGRPDRSVIAVSRWTDDAVRQRLGAAGVRTVAFDLLGDRPYDELPDAADVVFMVGAKFGSAGNPAPLWQTNAVVAGLAARRYQGSRIACFSTGNVYPFVGPASGGATERDAVGPVGEYAMSTLGRERVMTYAAQRYGTPMTLIRLNYAVELRYGVLADICTAVRDGRPIDVGAGYVNVVWQGYANEVALRSLTIATPEVEILNLTGPETLSVRALAEAAGDDLGVAPALTGSEAETALLNNAARCHELFGVPDVLAPTLLRWQTDWVRRGGVLWDKPTKFQVRDGQF